ncbi:hypothetical protein [Tissierella sp.]|uniref:hypothetical protein n=1 Tax=Tissierella sp. TaxID=41274 RepID=UPI003029E80E
MINKNDCFDCDNSIREGMLDPNSKWICEVTLKEIPEDGIQEHDCPYFKYPD